MENEVAIFMLKDKHNLQYKIKEVHQQIYKKEQELKRLKEKLVYLKCKFVEEKNIVNLATISSNGTVNDNDNSTSNAKGTATGTTNDKLCNFGDEHMRSFML